MPDQESVTATFSPHLLNSSEDEEEEEEEENDNNNTSARTTAASPLAPSSSSNSNDMKSLCESSANNQKKCRTVGEVNSSSSVVAVATSSKAPAKYKSLRTTKVPIRIVKKPSVPSRLLPPPSPASYPHPVHPTSYHFSHHNLHRSTVSPERLREQQTELFYRNYNGLEGVMTAAVLGGFFAFVCLLVVYKTKCKPMWKNRRKRLTNTPATQSLNNDSHNNYNPKTAATTNGVGGGAENHHVDFEDEDEDEEFECIPLQSVFTRGRVVVGGGDGDDAEEEEDDDDIFFLDEFGNYVFPTTPTLASSCCSCPQSAEMSVSSMLRRRQSQASCISTAYTVKSLPGAYLYIPLIDPGRHHHHPHLQGGPGGHRDYSSVSMSSIRRSLSDPEIHFSPPPFGQPIILASSEANGLFFGSSFHGLNLVRHQRHLIPRQLQQQHLPLQQRQSGGAHHRHRHPKLQQRSHSMQPDARSSSPYPGASAASAHRENFAVASSSLDNDFSIAIQIIQPTPNVSPTCSLRSFNGRDSADNNNINIQLSSPDVVVSSIRRRSSLISKADRRVSFSEGSAEIDNDDEEMDSRRPNSGSRKLAVPPMNYLQVPGQSPLSFMAPPMTLETQLAQTSSQARRRRTTRLMKAGSFCSIHSEGDGDMFGPTGELLSPEPFRRGMRSCGGRNDSIGGVSSISSVYCGERMVESRLSSYEGGGSSGSGRGGGSGNNPLLDPLLLSDYTEFQDDCRSDISELFQGEHARKEDERGNGKELKNQGTLSDQEGSIKSLSIDQEEVGFETPTSPPTRLKTTTTVTDSSRFAVFVPDDKKPYNNPEYDDIMQRHIMKEIDDDNVEEDEEEEEEKVSSSSSCSISMGSGDVAAAAASAAADRDFLLQQHQITVPVTIEHPPPEMRGLVEQQQQQQPPSYSMTLPSSSSLPPPPGLVRQETVHTDSGLETEDIMTVSPPFGASSADDRLYSRMVLVRDIGIQVCGDSPNLNMTRKYHEINPSSSSNYSSVPMLSTTNEQLRSSSQSSSSLRRGHRSKSEECARRGSDSFPTEILF